MEDFQKGSSYDKTGSTKKELRQLKLVQMHKIADEVLAIYNKNKKKNESSPTSELFFNALDVVWRKHKFNEKVKHEWYTEKNFYKDLIPVCHSIQPVPTKRSSKRKTFSKRDEEDYIRGIIESTEEVFNRRVALECSFKEALSFAIKSTWQRERKSETRKHLWKSKKLFNGFFKKYFESKEFLNNQPPKLE